MADYHPLIARAVAGLEKNTGEERRALYQRAREALVTQLRGVVPALSEADITRERLALEEAIRKVEAEAARQPRETARSEPQRREAAREEPPQQREAAREEPPQRREAAREEAPQQREAAQEASSRPEAARKEVPQRREAVREEAPQQRDAARKEAPRSPLRPQREVPQPPPPPNRTSAEPARASVQAGPAPTGLSAARAQPAAERSPDQSVKARNVAAETGPATRPTRQAFAPAAQASAEQARAEPRVEPEGLRPPRKPQEKPPIGPSFEPSIGGSLESPMMLDDPPPVRQRGQRAIAIADEPEEEPEPAHMGVGGFLRALIAVSVVLLLCGAVFWQRQTIMAAVRDLAGLDRPPAVLPPPPREANLSRAKIPDRLAPSGQSAQTKPPEALIAQRVVLYEEDPTDPAGKQYVGTATWRTETVSPGPGQPPDIVIRANIEIPDRQMKVAWSLRRNTDKSLPASHTVDLLFTLPPDFPHGGIANIPGLLMKQAEQTRGVPLAGQSVKVTTGYFLIGLSSVESDLQRNVQLLKERTWFDIPIVYTDGRRAILAVEKGSPGETAFAEAFNAWTQ
jgi:hypothetical protein